MLHSRLLEHGKGKLGAQVTAAEDKEDGGPNGQQAQSRGFRHGLEGQCNRPIQPGGKGAFDSTRRELINVAAAEIRLKQIARAIKSQSKRVIQPGSKSALRSTRREFKDALTLCIRHKQIARAVNGQSSGIQPGGNDALHSARCEFMHYTGVRIM